MKRITTMMLAFLLTLSVGVNLVSAKTLENPLRGIVPNNFRTITAMVGIVSERGTLGISEELYVETSKYIAEANLDSDTSNRFIEAIKKTKEGMNTVTNKDLSTISVEEFSLFASNIIEAYQIIGITVDFSPEQEALYFTFTNSKYVIYYGEKANTINGFTYAVGEAIKDIASALSTALGDDSFIDKLVEATTRLTTIFTNEFSEAIQ